MKNKNNVELSVIIGSNAVPEYVKNDSVFIEGREGSEYSLKIKNHNGYRVKVIIGIDGINIVNSELIGDSKDEIGYILEAYQETIIKGYRIDDKSVGSFKFVAKNAAYANTDKGQEGKTTGVIICRVYREKESQLDKMAKQLSKLEKDLDNEKFKWPKYVPIYPKVVPHNPWYDPYWEYPYTKPYWTCATQTYGTANSDIVRGVSNSAGATYCATLGGGNAQCSATNAKSNPDNVGTATSVNFVQHLDNKAVCDNQAVEPRQDSPFSLGSAWGSKVESTVKETKFETGDYLGELILYYTNRAGLESLGIEFKKVAKVSVFPNPAPASKKYCAVPSGWSG